MMSEEIKIEIKEGTITAKRWGAGASKKILAIHGWLDNANSFDKLAPLLCQNYEIVCIDLPGHGHSFHKKSDGVYYPAEWLIYLDQIIERLGWNALSIMGHSMGAGIASFYATVCEREIESLILIDGLSPLPANENEAHDFLEKYFLERVHITAKKNEYSSFEKLVSARKLVGGISLEAAEILMKRNFTKSGQSYLASSDTKLKHSSPIRFTKRQVEVVLEKLKCPILLIEAIPTEGLSLPARWMDLDALSKRLPNMTKSQLKGSHYIHLEEEAELSQKILRFFQ
jgi:pimeloyl-ACP methyl ester carboxylesterase